MKKKYICNIKKLLILFLCILVVTPMSATAYSSTGTKDTVTIGPYSGEYKTFEEALANVKDGGTIYIKPLLSLSQYYLFNNVVIDKNITIEGIESNNYGLPKIGWKSTVGEESAPLITINSPYTLQMKNLIFRSLPEKVIIHSNTSNLSLEKVYFTHSHSLIIDNPTDNSDLNININNCSFDVYPLEILLNENSSGYISLTNNIFQKNSLIISSTGVSIQMSDNYFIDSGLIVEALSQKNINIKNNVFEGYKTNIFAQASEKLNISYNCFTSDNIAIVNNNEVLPLDLRYNWWGSNEGPFDRDGFFDLNGEVDYSNWSLDENFSLFNGASEESYGSITGTALLQNTMNHENIGVSLLCDSNMLDTTYTDQLGYFEFDNIEYGTYSLSFTYKDFITVAEEVYLDTGSVSLDTVLYYNSRYVDINDDGSITESDLEKIADAYGSDIDSYEWNNRLDLNRNDIIDIYDMIILFRFREVLE